MSNKYLRHLTSVITGTIAIYILMQIDEWTSRTKMTEGEYQELSHVAISDLFIIGLFFLFVMAIQFAVIMPAFAILTMRNKLTTKNIILTGVIISLTCGLIFGLQFGTIELGLGEILKSIGLGILIFSVFYITDLWTFKKLTV